MISTLVIAYTLLSASPEDFSNLFKAGECHYTGGRYHNEVFRYRLLVPTSLQPTRRYPLLVWLHGVGEGGEDNQSQLKYLDMAVDHPNRAKGQQLFLLAVQCPPSNPAWFQKPCDADSTSGDEMITVTVDILRKVMQEHPVDQDRVYLAGISGGGSGCWEMAVRYPQLFAAVAPMSSGGGDASRAAILQGIPIWAFHNPDDTTSPPDQVKAMVDAVAKAGGNAHLTFTSPAPMAHDSWTAALTEHDVLGWLLAQRRGTLCWTPPGFRPWKWRHILATPGTFLAIVWLGWRLERRRRQRLRKKLDLIEPLTQDSGHEKGLPDNSS